MLYSARPNLYTHHQLFQILHYIEGGGRVGSKLGGPRPFFVSEFTFIHELFEHNFVDFHLIWEVGGKVGGPCPFLVVVKFLYPPSKRWGVYLFCHSVCSMSKESFKTPQRIYFLGPG